MNLLFALANVRKGRQVISETRKRACVTHPDRFATPFVKSPRIVGRQFGPAGNIKTVGSTVKKLHMFEFTSRLPGRFLFHKSIGVGSYCFKRAHLGHGGVCCDTAATPHARRGARRGRPAARHRRTFRHSYLPGRVTSFGSATYRGGLPVSARHRRCDSGIEPRSELRIH